jgi:3-oxoacyl-[acyl-carrier-protein] synthase-1
MKVVYKIADNIISSLGINTAENMAAIYSGQTGILLHSGRFGVPEPFPASVVDFDRITATFGTSGREERYTRFEQMVISSVVEAGTHTNVDFASPETLFVVSTTKGNVSLLDPGESHEFIRERANLWASGKEIVAFFKNPNKPVIISQACISGVSAIIVARMYLESGRYKHIIVTGGDVLSKFIISGFQSFKALSPDRCKPFDAARDGLSLGEGAATIVLGIADESGLPGNCVAFIAGATSNDANHISGPSRTGEGLYRAIMRTKKEADFSNLGFINAHGTATPFNDEMESVALSRAGLLNVPVNSLKGYIGHTLGAAGLIETVVCSDSLMKSRLVMCLGFNTPGVSEKINVITKSTEFEGTECLKMASGFGGCNAVIHLKKYR